MFQPQRAVQQTQRVDIVFVVVVVVVVVAVLSVLAITCCATNKHGGWKAASKQRTGEGSWPEAHNAALSLPPCPPCISRTVVSSRTRLGLGLTKV